MVHAADLGARVIVISMTICLPADSTLNQSALGAALRDPATPKTPYAQLERRSDIFVRIAPRKVVVGPDGRLTPMPSGPLRLGGVGIMGEFGASLMVAGSIPQQTQTLSMAIYDAVQAGDQTRRVAIP